MKNYMLTETRHRIKQFSISSPISKLPHFITSHQMMPEC